MGAPAAVGAEHEAEGSSGVRYPGAPPFGDTELDRLLFRGRAKEAEAVLHEILSGDLFVLYAVSGMGKSSLLNAAVVKPLRDRGLWPIVLRLNDPGISMVRLVEEQITEAARRAEDITVVRHPLSIAAGRPDTLWDLLSGLEVWKGTTLQKPVLIFDQFEELFTLSWSEEARRRFITEFGWVVRRRRPEGVERGSPDSLPPPDVKIVTVIREDSLGELESFADDVPLIMRNRLRLVGLDLEQAEHAIREPALIDDPRIRSPKFTYSGEAAKALLDFLRTREERGMRVLTSTVEPPQLQIICQHVERTILQGKHPAPGEVVQITADDLGGEDGLNEILQDFYRREIKNFAPDVQSLVRDLCETGLINDRGRRLSLEEGEIEADFHLSKEILSDLVDRRLLRAEPRVGSVYYELAHDTLVAPILDYRNELRAQEAQAVARADAERRLAIAADARQEAERRADAERHLREEEEERRRSVVRSRRRLGILAMMLAVVAAFAVTLGVVAVNRAQEATDRAHEATERTQRVLLFYAASLAPAPATVPALEGGTVADVEGALAAAGLVGGRTEAHSDTVPAGTVFAQAPAAGTEVDQGSEVEYTVSLGPVAITVPALGGGSAPEAEWALAADRLEVGRRTEAHSDTVPAGTVFGQAPAAGTEVMSGSRVDYTVSLGPSSVTVPALEGRSVVDVEGALAAARLVGGRTEAHADTVPAGTIFAQAPAAGTEVDQGSKVAYIVSLGPAPVTVPPDHSGWYEVRAHGGEREEEGFSRFVDGFEEGFWIVLQREPTCARQALECRYDVSIRTKGGAIEGTAGIRSISRSIILSNVATVAGAATAKWSWQEPEWGVSLGCYESKNGLPVGERPEGVYDIDSAEMVIFISWDVEGQILDVGANVSGEFDLRAGPIGCSDMTRLDSVYRGQARTGRVTREEGSE